MKSRWIWIAGLALAAACGDSGDDGGDDDDDNPPVMWNVEVTSDAPLDRIIVYHPGAGEGGTVGPITPERRVRGELGDEPATVHVSDTTIVDQLAGTSTATAVLTYPFVPQNVVVLGQRRDPGGILVIVTFGAVMATSADQIAMRLPVHLTAETLVGLELWNGETPCLRLGATNPPTYYVLPDDLDCDAVASADDCDDLDYGAPDHGADCP